MNIKKRSMAYALAATIYFVFDIIYMPWLVGYFGYDVFVPLGLSIWIANWLGVFAYDAFDEDVLFIELGKNWIRGGKSEAAKTIGKIGKKFPITADALTFVALSIFPSPIAGYVAFRDRIGEGQLKRLAVLALGSIPCTLVWGGGMSVIWVNSQPWDLILFALLLATLICRKRRMLVKYHCARVN